MTVDLSVKPEVKGFFDAATNTISYVVKDPASTSCAIVDSVMDIDYAAGRITYDHADQLIAHVRDHGLTLDWLFLGKEDGLTRTRQLELADALKAVAGAGKPTTSARAGR